MKIFSFVLFIFQITTLFASLDGDGILIINSITISQTLPQRFRTTSDLLDKNEPYAFSQKGLSSLNASASAQFSVEELRALMRSIKKNLVIFDLRKEPHGFLNQYAVSWYIPNNWLNAQIAHHEALIDEQNRLKALLTQPELLVHKIVEKNQSSAYATVVTLPLKAHYTQTEKELCRHLNIPYVRIPVVDHLHPSCEAVEDFIHAVKNLPAGSWPHFHCKAGQGRATTFLAMYDMMRHAKEVSLEDIILRQSALGGIDLFRTLPEDNRKFHLFNERRQFLVKFYHYCRTQAPHFSMSWRQWEAKNNEFTLQNQPL